ncbi:MAG: efflux RND transporter periplasmic adaptor subunit [Thermoanaerobaculia bacterium]|nr:efflux RND transporter periplasmic adaptor subunit [Thermoanaerobaculia bacterium]
MAKAVKLVSWVVILLVLAAVVLLPRWIDGSGTVVEPVEVEIDPRVPVRIETVRAMPLEERLNATGTVLPNEAVEVVSEIAGKVEAILFEEGARVASGAVLVRLDRSTLEAERDRAAHRHSLLLRQEERQRRLLGEGLISTEEYDFTAGELAVARADLELREALLDKAEIRAPFAGRVGLRLVSPGSYVSSQTRVTTLQQLDPVKVEFSIPESYARDVEAGDRIRFRVQGIDDRFEGEVYAREPAIDPETRGLRLRARAANPDGRLIPGAFAEIELTIRSVDEALAVPSIAVLPEMGGKKLFVLEDGRAVARPVQTGIRTTDRVEIVDGLAPGERIIVSNVARLSSGTEVRLESSGQTGGAS